MKKLFTIILMAATILTACTKENNPVANKIVTINATIAGNTKVVLGENDETKVNWTEGDIIILTFISEAEYPFKWKEGTTFEYDGDGSAPFIFYEGYPINATYRPVITGQTGFKADVGKYMALSANKTITTEKDWGDVKLEFTHNTSVLKLTISNDAFKGNDVTGVTLKANNETVVTATGTFTGSTENGSVTVYFAIPTGSLENITIHATCNGNTYTNSLENKTVEAGKIYHAEKNLPYAYVDLGLSVKWASFNVGATGAKGFGDYFAWGETGTKETYGFSNYQYTATGTNTTLTKYCHDADYGYEDFTDGLTTLVPGDDAATAKWGNYWRMPKKNEMQELIDNCTWTWTTQNEVSGYMITSTVAGYTDKSIFIPAAGYKDYDGTLNFENESGYYWSSSLSAEFTYQAYYLYISERHSHKFNEIWGDFRSRGQSVRPVYVGN